MKMVDTTKEITTNEDDKTYTVGINLKIPEELIIKIADKINKMRDDNHIPHLLILSHEYAHWFSEYLQVNQYLEYRFNTIARFLGLEIKITSRDDVIEVY